MIARAPGKLVMSGAYAVLEGAPCLVAAVDRYVVADASRSAPFVTDEVRAALDAGALPGPAPWFDASALRDHAPDGTSRKLGLGSSAAILVASLAASIGDRFSGDRPLRDALFPIALAAHRQAQGGGSGVDVAASVFGGVLLAHLAPEQRGRNLEVDPFHLPAGTHVDVFASPVSAITRDLLARVASLAARDPGRHRACLDAAARGARAAVEAPSVPALVMAISAQTDALTALGEAAGAPIVTEEVISLRPIADAEGGTFAPSGAGGGDIAIFVGRTSSSAAFRQAAAARGLSLLDLKVGAPGAGRTEALRGSSVPPQRP
jgi:phosphomevalonate kinase